MPSVRQPRWREDLKALVACHSTPGDEDEVAAFLRTAWADAGWTVASHGRSAVSARLPRRRPRQPTLLVCAHMDSPGFSIQAVGEVCATVIPLGKPVLEGVSTEVILKTRDDRTWLVLEKDDTPGKPATYWTPTIPGMTAGDRLCYHGSIEVTRSGRIRGPFLDNRLGCAVLCEVARRAASGRLGVNLVLGATASEEMGGYGAAVLAHAIRPDLVICLDATYDSMDHGVQLGGGPVLTLSDASVLLGSHERDGVLAFAQSAGVPLQTEVYNVSGTDARAFPHAGLPARVYPLLLPTLGNHSPSEEAVSADVEALLTLLEAALKPAAWRSFFVSDFA